MGTPDRIKRTASIERERLAIFISSDYFFHISKYGRLEEKLVLDLCRGLCRGIEMCRGFSE